jgi:hypothetical protein
LVTPSCSGISFVWRVYGPQKPNEVWPADTQESCFPKT